MLFRYEDSTPRLVHGRRSYIHYEHILIVIVFLRHLAILFGEPSKLVGAVGDRNCARSLVSQQALSMTRT